MSEKMCCNCAYGVFLSNGNENDMKCISPKTNTSACKGYNKGCCEYECLR